MSSDGWINVTSISLWICGTTSTSETSDSSDEAGNISSWPNHSIWQQSCCQYRWDYKAVDKQLRAWAFALLCTCSVLDKAFSQVVTEPWGLLIVQLVDDSLSDTYIYKREIKLIQHTLLDKKTYNFSVWRKQPDKETGTNIQTQMNRLTACLAG